MRTRTIRTRTRGMVKRGGGGVDKEEGDKVNVNDRSGTASRICSSIVAAVESIIKIIVMGGTPNPSSCDRMDSLPGIN